MKTTMKRVKNLVLVFRLVQTSLRANHSLSSNETLRKMPGATGSEEQVEQTQDGRRNIPAKGQSDVASCQGVG